MPKAVRPGSVVKPKPVLNTYYVFNQSLKALGGVSVVERGEDRVVLLTEAQAQYWIDQGVIGSSPLDQQSQAAQSVIKQMSRIE